MTDRTNTKNAAVEAFISTSIGTRGGEGSRMPAKPIAMTVPPSAAPICRRRCVSKMARNTATPTRIKKVTETMRATESALAMSGLINSVATRATSNCTCLVMFPSVAMPRPFNALGVSRRHLGHGRLAGTVERSNRIRNVRTQAAERSAVGGGEGGVAPRSGFSITGAAGLRLAVPDPAHGPQRAQSRGVAGRRSEGLHLDGNAIVGVHADDGRDASRSQQGGEIVAHDQRDIVSQGRCPAIELVHRYLIRAVLHDDLRQVDDGGYGHRSDDDDELGKARISGTGRRRGRAQGVKVRGRACASGGEGRKRRRGDRGNGAYHGLSSFLPRINVDGCCCRYSTKTRTARAVLVSSCIMSWRSCEVGASLPRSDRSASAIARCKASSVFVPSGSNCESTRPSKASACLSVR